MENADKSRSLELYLQVNTRVETTTQAGARVETRQVLPVSFALSTCDETDICEEGKSSCLSVVGHLRDDIEARYREDNPQNR